MNFDRRHAVSAEQEQAWRAVPSSHGSALNDTSQWVPQTVQGYAAVLDHGIRTETRGIVIHVNDGFYHGTIGFFTNGLSEPYGSEGVGAHFEMGGQANSLTGVYADGPPYQFLPLDAIAWHGVAANMFAVGIEHAGFGYSTDEWTKTHYNEVGNSAYRAAWVLRRYNLGPPVISLTNPDHGNVWPHSCGGEAWGGHVCPASTQNGIDYFPWELWLSYCSKAYKQKWQWN